MRANGQMYLAAAGVLLLSACAENDSSLYVAGVLASPGSGCEYSPDPGSLQLFSGVLDVAFRSKYEGVVLVGNQLTPRGNKEELRTETSGFRIRGAEVQLTNSQGAVLDEFSVNGGGFVQTTSSEGAGYGLAQVTMIPPSRGRALEEELQGNRGAKRTLIANVRVFGETLGGVEITSGDFTFPIDVCWGCLVQYPLEAIIADEVTGEFVCGGPADGVKLEQCVPGQDEFIDCRACAAVTPVCFRLD
jgi:hypothetical protein